MLDGVTTLRLDRGRRARSQDPPRAGGTHGKFLLYAPTEEPDYEDDWLLDIRLYSRSFRADRASILLQELGLVNQHLRTHLADRRKFFDAKERLQKLKNLVAAGRHRRRPRPQDDRRGRPRPTSRNSSIWCGRSSTPGSRPGARSTSTIRPPSGARSRSSISTFRSGRWSKPRSGTRKRTQR